MHIVLQRFKDEGMMVYMKKSFFGLQEMKHFSYMVSEASFQFPPRKSALLKIGMS
jgi:hypothetical protein